MRPKQAATAFGTSVGAAYGLLECLSALGQVAISLLGGITRQAGGFPLALRAMFAGLLLALPATFYAQRAVERAVRAMRQIARPQHALLIEVQSRGDLGKPDLRQLEGPCAGPSRYRGVSRLVGR